MSEIKHCTVITNGIHMQIAESGAWPWWCCVTVFPNHGIRWRHQLHALAEAGFHAFAAQMAVLSPLGRKTRYAQKWLFGLTP